MEASSRIFVKGLPMSMSVEDFRRHFSKQSPITDAKLIPHRRIGYVGFQTPEDALKAVQYHNRSFIRMSKIGVELARSVDEQQKLSKVYRGGARANQNFTMHSNGEQHEGNDDIDATAPATKKRRLSANNDEEDDKLQEFLHIMQPPSKFRDWKSQDLFDGGRRPIASAERERPGHLSVDSKDDEQPEPVNTKQKDLDNEESSAVKQVLEEKGLSSIVESSEGQNTESLEVGQKSSGIEMNEEPATSDENWLRSRTSRVLGLEGNDDGGTIALQSKGQETLDNTDANGEDLMFGQSVGFAVGERVEEDGVSTQVEQASPDTEQHDVGNGRLFLRNLTYTCTEKDIRNHFKIHRFEGIEEVHLPLDLRGGEGKNKGFAYVQFADHQTALSALRDLDQKPFQGRLLHVLSANPKPIGALDEFAISKLPHKQQQRIRRKAEASSSTFNWNSMYMSSDAVMSSISDRLGVSKSELLDPTSSDAAVKQAHAETHIIQETKSYFAANGVDLASFQASARGLTAILVKNFPYGTKIDELRDLLDTYGPLKRLLMPPFGTIAIVEFEQEDHARSAFGNLSYSKFKNSILFLEKAPNNLFSISNKNGLKDARGESEVRQAKPSTVELLGEEQTGFADTSTLFVRNLSFNTTNERLQEAFKSLDGFISARVKMKPDPKAHGATLSMGYGFLEFRSKKQAQAALAAMDGYKLDGHALLVRASHKAVDAAEERRDQDRAKKVAERRTKIIIKNLPFEATKKDVRSLFGAYGQVRSVRVPKKFDSSTRGFAFADFITAREAENAMDALKDTHFLGRRLVLQFAAEEEVDPEAAIQQMQKKVGKQVDKVALQKLTGTGRKKFNIVDKADGLDQLVED